MASQELPSYMTASTFVTTVNGVPSTGVVTMVIASALPTQALPPYLSASTFTTVVGGVTTLGVSTVGVPITYFGPSIPLGPDDVWTFGGSTSPASTSQPTSTAIPSSSLSSSSIPSSSVTSISSSATASSSVSESGTTSIVSPSSTTGTFGASTSGVSTSGVSTSGASTSGASTSGASTSGASTSTGSSSAGPIPTSSGVSRSSTLHRALPGIIIAAIVVAIALIMLLCLWRYRRRRRGLTYHPNDSDFVFVDDGGVPRRAGEGVPRPTGEEEDPFLRRSGEATDGMQQADSSARLVTIPSRTGTEATTGTAPLPEGVVPTALKAVSSKGSPSVRGSPNPFFHASASSLFFNPSRGPDPAVVGAGVIGSGKRDSASTRQSSASASPVIGNIIPPRQLLQMEDEWRQEDAQATPVAAHRGTSELGERVGEYGETPLCPPPVLNPDRSASIPRPSSQLGTIGSTPESLGSDPDENATLLTATRVMLNGSGPTTLVEVGNDGSSPSSWGSSLAMGLGGLTRLSRLSWFQRMEAMRSHSQSQSQSQSRSPNRSEPGRAPSRSATPGSSQRRPVSFAERAGLTVPRPISHLSVGSGHSTGDTLFYDALSSVSTRSGHGHGPSPARSGSAPPVPRPHTATPTTEPPASAPHTPPAHDSSSGSQVHVEQPVAPSPIHPSPSRSREVTLPDSTPTRAPPTAGPDEPLDVLDTPVPTAISPFSTTSSRGGPTFPPGLEHHIANIRVWRESSSDMPSPASFGTAGGGLEEDILEEEPPRPREGWTHLRNVTSGTVGTVDTGRRTTLGQPILVDLNDDDSDEHHNPQHNSQHGSLHSLPSRLSPFSPAGSGPNSRAPSRHTQYGSSTYSSGSSRSPSRLTPREGSGSSSQLAHSNSITSDGRRRPRREPGEPLASPPPSTPASSAYGRARLSALGGPRSALASPQLSPAHNVTTFEASMTATGAPSSSTMSDSATAFSGGSHTSRATVAEPQPQSGDIVPHPFAHWPTSGENVPL